jgi:ketosteroid isomerase-like protein
VVREAQQVSDRDAVRAVVVRYFVGVDRLDPEMIDSTYHPDAVDVRGPRTIHGATAGEDIVATNSKSMATTRHHITTHHIEVDGDTAVSEAYCLGVHVTAGEPGRRMQTSGRYIDRLERRTGEWRIAQREVFVDMMKVSDLGDEMGR